MVWKQACVLVAVCCLALLWTGQSGFAAGAAQVVVRDDLAAHFEAYDAGTFVLYNEEKQQYVLYNAAQSRKRLSPCSSFKIFSALAGLESGVLDRSDANTLRKWDGRQRSIAAWNQDQTLASAIQNSVVWYFQAFIAEIGAARMQAYLDAIDYGNRDISGGLTQFWLQSSLLVSAREQVDLLRKLCEGQLPVAPENVSVVLEDITLYERNGARLLGKTGTGDGAELGWFVGCVERGGNRCFFAVNLEGRGNASGANARAAAEQILREMRLL